MHKINKFLKDNKKIIMFVVFMLIFTTACTAVRDKDGNVDPAKLISLDTPFLKSVGESLFNVFVWPIAQMLNLIAEVLDAGIAIILTTIIINVGVALLTLKQQVSNQKMQELQPEQKKIQAKYEGKTDQASRMKQAQEIQALYKKNDINPMGAIVSLLIQLPLILAMYQAVNRSAAVNNGYFLGKSLTITPKEGIANGDIAIIAIFVLMLVFSLISTKVPQWLAKYKKSKMNIKTKEYADPKKKDGIGNSMNMVMYFSTVMMGFFAYGWPIGMTLYWLVGSVTRIAQNIVIQIFIIDKKS